MQKKILASLMVSPVAFTALADINVTMPENFGSAWQCGADLIDYLSTTDGKVTGKSGIGSITNSLEVPVAGRYKLTFSDWTNAKLALDVQGAVVTYDETAKTCTVEFKMDAAGTVKITVTAVDDSQVLSFGGGDLLITNVDFDELKTALQAELDKVATLDGEGNAVLTVNITDDEGNVTVTETLALDPANTSGDADNPNAADALRTRLASLAGDISGIIARIDALPAESADNGDKYAAYTTTDGEDLWLDDTTTDPKTLGDKIAQAIAPLASTADALKDEIAAENARYTAYTTNLATLNDMLAAIGGDGNSSSLEAIFKAVTDQIDGYAAVNDTYTSGVKDRCADARTAIRSAIDAYKGKVDAAKTALEASADGSVEIPESEYDTIKASIDELQAAYGDYVANEEAYYTNFATLESELQAAYNSAYRAINAIQGAEGYENVFADFKAGKFNDIAVAKQSGDDLRATVDATNALAATEVAEGATSSVLDQIKAVIDEINATATAATAFATAENDAWTAGLGVIDELNQLLAAAELSDKEIGFLSADQKTEYAAKLAAIKGDAGSIATLLGKYVEHYTANTLSTTDYDFTADANAIKAAINDLTTWIGDQDLDKKIVAQDELDNIYSIDVNDDGTTDESDAINDWVKSKFSATIAALQTAVNAITTDNTEVLSTIAATKANIKQLQQAYNAAEATLEPFKAAYGKLDAVVKGKTQVAGSTFDSAGITASLATFAGYATDWQADWNTAMSAEETAQTAYDKLTALAATISGSNWQDAITAAFNSFEYGDASATKANYAAAEAAVNVLKANANANFADESAAAKALADVETALADAKTLLDAITGDVDLDYYTSDEAKKAVDDRVAACAAVDDACAAVIAQLDPISKALDAYATLTGDNYLAKARQAVVDTKTFNAEPNCYAPASDYFAQLIGDPDASTPDATKHTFGGQEINALAYTLSALAADIDSYLADLTIASKTDEVGNRVEGLVDLCNAIQTRITANEKAYASHLAESQSVRKALNDAINEFTAKIGSAEGLANAEEVVANIKALRDKQLPAVDDNVFSTYGQGALLDAQYSPDYSALLTQLDSYKAEFATDYEADILAANQTYVGTAVKVGTDSEGNDVAKTKDGLTQELRTNYITAIGIYNDYKSIDNAGYKAYILDPANGFTTVDAEGNVTASPFVSNERFYDDAANYRAIVQKLDAFIAECNATTTDPETGETTGPTLIKDYTDAAGNTYESLMAEAYTQLVGFQTAYTDLQTTFNAAGEAYYQKYTAELTTQLTDAETAMTAAGVAADDAAAGIAEAKKPMDAAATAYAEGAGTSGKGIGLDMDGIADTLDTVAVDTEAICASTWDAKYAEAAGKIAEWDKAIQAFTATTPDLTAYTAKKNAVTALDTAAQAIIADASDPFIDDLAQYLADLDKAMGNGTDSEGTADAAYQGVEYEYNLLTQAEENATAEAGLKATLEGQYDDLAAALKALQDYVLSMGGTSSTSTDAAATAVADFNTAITVTYVGALKANEATITGLKTAAESAIATAYQSAMANELSFLKELLAQAKVSFNNAIAAQEGVEGSTFDEAAFAARIDALNAGGADDVVATMSAFFDAAEADTDGFQTAALAYEKKICTIIAELQQYYDNVADETLVPDAILAELNELAATLQGNINAAAATIGDYYDDVKAIYTEKIDALQATLNQLKAAYEAAAADGSIIAGKDSYKRQIEALQAELDQLIQDAADANAAAAVKAVSEAVYATLMGQYDELVAARDSYTNLIEEYDLTEAYYHLNRVNSINTNLQKLLDNLNDRHNPEAGIYGLTEGDVLVDSEGNVTFATVMNTVQYGILYAKHDHATNKLTAATDAMSAVDAALSEATLTAADRAAIVDKLDALKTSGQTISGNVATFKTLIGTYVYGNSNIEPDFDGGVTVIDGYINEALALIADAEALAQQIADNSFTPGVLTGDHTAPDASDLSAIIEWVGKGYTYDYIAENYSANTAKAADLSKDGNIKINDVTLLVQAIVDPGTFAYAPRHFKATDSGFDAVLVAEENGVRTYALNLHNSEAFIAGQLDLSVAAGSEIVEVSAGERLAAHDMALFDNSDATRVVITSLQNAEIAGNDGCTLYVKVKGHSSVGITNAIFADNTHQGYALGDKTPGTSGIDSIIDGARVVKEAIYDAAGRALNKVQRGINIIRHSDGTVTKELHK